MDSSRTAQRTVIQFLLAEGEHASQIYHRIKEVYGEQCLARCTIFRWCQRHETGQGLHTQSLSRTCHTLGRRALRPTVPRFRLWHSSYRQNRRITTCEIAIELSISKGTVHHIIHNKLGQSFCTVGTQASVRSRHQRIRRRRERVFA
ncbi:hypothetical protein AVEN_219002-1 [Araneus ventricosus]|uniref:Mos1 transposase HTH domain-containing protein n=1 Tax=Araneus ventricosus TaxID=182803 RepID=A0A4Y2CD28_ARAVE|nr:hypothetical protein AVEN_219002-1 [Araneus ventricosus]